MNVLTEVSAKLRDASKAMKPRASPMRKGSGASTATVFFAQSPTSEAATTSASLEMGSVRSRARVDPVAVSTRRARVDLRTTTAHWWSSSNMLSASEESSGNDSMSEGAAEGAPNSSKSVIPPSDELSVSSPKLGMLSGSDDSVSSSPRIAERSTAPELPVRVSNSAMGTSNDDNDDERERPPAVAAVEASMADIMLASLPCRECMVEGDLVGVRRGRVGVAAFEDVAAFAGDVEERVTRVVGVDRANERTEMVEEVATGAGVVDEAAAGADLVDEAATGADLVDEAAVGIDFVVEAGIVEAAAAGADLVEAAAAVLDVEPLAPV